MDAVDVTARFDSRGRAMPSSFKWYGVDYFVDSIGRRWVEEDGQHILVMVPGGRVFELLYKPVEGEWYLIPVGGFRSPS
ncbi:MAG: hypothetical protein PVF74_02300 [Anaerolineales bacterium]|jgi:hypothetical protein